MKMFQFDFWIFEFCIALSLGEEGWLWHCKGKSFKHHDLLRLSWVVEEYRQGIEVVVPLVLAHLMWPIYQ